VDGQSHEGVTSVGLVRDITKVKSIGVGGRHGASMRRRKCGFSFSSSQKKALRIMTARSLLSFPQRRAQTRNSLRDVHFKRLRHI